MDKNAIVVSMSLEDIAVMNALTKKQIGHLFYVIGLHGILPDDVLEKLLYDDELVNLFRRIKTPDYELTGDNGDSPFEEE